MKIKIIITLFILGLFLGFNQEVKADWQSDLEGSFDIVETFDQLQDWSGTGSSYVYDQELMPNKLDGTDSIWQHYFVNEINDGSYPDWISDHGVGYNWNPNHINNPKSLLIQYNYLYHTDDDSELGQGPARLATFFGDGVTGKSGYKSIHIFFMIKFHADFFAEDDEEVDEYEFIEAIKGFDTMAGFTSIDQYGTDEEWNSICLSQNNRREYGTNFNVMNYSGGGSSYATDLFMAEHIGVTTYNAAGEALDGSIGCYAYESGDPVDHYRRDANFISSYNDDEWFGIELWVDVGDVGQSNGQSGIYIYDDSGALIGSETRTGQHRLEHFDMWNNKFLFGGNRAGNGFSVENRVYVDDLVIDDQPIASMYFALLNNNVCDLEHPYLCTTETTCTNAENTWCTNFCQSESNCSPIANITTDKTSGLAPLTVNFNANTSTDNGTITNYQWNFGDSSPVNNTINPTYTFTTAGTYQTTLTVTDNEGATDQSTQIITVTAEPGDECDSSHLNLCTTETTCSTATGHWCNDTCQSTSCDPLSTNMPQPINFQPSDAPIPEEYLVDSEGSFSAENGYGWTQPPGSVGARDRNDLNSPDQRYDTFVTVNPTGVWEMALDNGTYQVTICSGDTTYPGGIPNIQIEGTTVISGVELSPTNRWIEETSEIEVNDGRLTMTFVDSPDSTRINWITVNLLSPPTTIRADVDQQNGITSTDAMLILRNSLGLNMTNTNWQSSNTTGDVNCDGITNSTDAMLILRYSLGLDMSESGWCVE